VICTADGGHYAIESPHQPGHCPRPDSPLEQGRHDSEPCNDRPAAGGLALQAPHRPLLHGKAVDAVHASTLVALPDLSQCPDRIAVTHASSPPARTGHLRTVILLI
jgi:hypothetical protein